MKWLTMILFALLVSSSTRAQVKFGVGAILGLDIYQFVDQGLAATNVESTTTGSFLGNIVLGPKLWLGGSEFSISAESQLNWGMFALDIDDYKGLGSLAFPLLLKLNTGAASGFNHSRLIGFSIGGGIQYTNTEIYYTEDRFKSRIETGYLRTYVAEVSVSFGSSGSDMSLYFRYGRNEAESRNIHVGLIMSANFKHMAALRKKEKEELPIFESYAHK